MSYRCPVHWQGRSGLVRERRADDGKLDALADVRDAALNRSPKYLKLG